METFQIAGKRSPSRFAVVLCALSLLGATFMAGNQMSRWRRIDTLADAQRTNHGESYETKRRAIVAMLRETRVSVSVLRELQQDEDPKTAEHARIALENIRAELR